MRIVLLEKSDGCRAVAVRRIEQSLRLQRETALHFLDKAASEEQAERAHWARRVDVDGVRLPVVQHEVGSVVPRVVSAANIVMRLAPVEHFDGEQPQAVPVMLTGGLMQEGAARRVKPAPRPGSRW